MVKEQCPENKERMSKTNMFVHVCATLFDTNLTDSG
jgi:hypothetical protein